MSMHEKPMSARTMTPVKRSQVFDLKAFAIITLNMFMVSLSRLLVLVFAFFRKLELGLTAIICLAGAISGLTGQSPVSSMTLEISDTPAEDPEEALSSLRGSSVFAI